MPSKEKKTSARPVDFYNQRYVNREKIKGWYRRELALRTVKALQRNGFDAVFAESMDAARDIILRLVPEGATVGVGGSMTVRETGVPQILHEQGRRLFDHWRPGLNAEEIMAIRRAHLTCDVFLTGANALTSDGRLVSCDMAGNRVCAMTFGPRKVVIIVGVNKIVDSLDEALRRIKEVAAPQTMRDSGFAAPCGQTGMCIDCESPQRGCRVTVILERKPYYTDTTVVVVGEPVGF
ncbi:MAG: lactate utilization protein [Chloroflexi bacterium]|nr:lactate utilization protein [Chloroflexota bacterium]